MSSIISGFFPVKLTWKSLISAVAAVGGTALAATTTGPPTGVSTSIGVTGIVALVVTRIVDAIDYRTDGGIKPSDLTDLQTKLTTVRDQWQEDHNNLLNQYHTDLNAVRAQAAADLAAARSAFAAAFGTPTPPATTTTVVSAPVGQAGAPVDAEGTPIAAPATPVAPVAPVAPPAA